MGRATQGVTLIAVDQGTTLTGVQRVVERDAAENGLAVEGAEDPDEPAA
jgi:DNA gyrase subunit A